jgi:hypothetical protein
VIAALKGKSQISVGTLSNRWLKRQHLDRMQDTIADTVPASKLGQLYRNPDMMGASPRVGVTPRQNGEFLNSSNSKCGCHVLTRSHRAVLLNL